MTTTTHSTMPSPESSAKTLPAPPSRVEVAATQRLSNIAIAICVGDMLVHFLVWVLQ